MDIKDDYFSSTKIAIQNYLEERLLLIKLKAVNAGSKAAGSIAVIVVASLLAIAFLVLLGITGGLLFASLTGSYAAGFGIITFIYLLLIAGVVFLLKKPIESMVVNKLIQQIFNKENEVHQVHKTQNNGQHTHN